MSERLGRVVPLVIGGLMVLESGLVLLIAGLTLIIGGLAGMLAFVAGAGAATDAQLVQGFVMIVVTLASPFVVSGLLGLCGLLLLVRRGRGWVVALGVFALMAQLGVHFVSKEGIHAWELVPFAIHAAALIGALVCLPARPATYSKTPAGTISASYRAH